MLTPFPFGIKRGHLLRFFIVGRKENFLAGVADGSAAVQGENDNAFAVDAALDVAKV
jgi:hypothetical protein